MDSESQIPRKKKLDNTALIIVAVVIGAPVLFVLGFAALVCFFIFPTRTVMTKDSPDGQHRAKLVRLEGIDLMFRIYLDGEKVYHSPDFAPQREDCREQIAWDKTGQIVVLEVGGKRIAGYHAAEKRVLKDEEVLAVEYRPFHELGFEGELPEEKVRVKKPNAVPNANKAP